jgi:hypothetical protein
LDARVDDGGSLAEQLPDPETPGPDLTAALRLERERLRHALRTLPAEVREIIILHWGLDGSAGWSVRAVARHVGRTTAEVHTVIQGALRWLRDGRVVSGPTDRGDPGWPTRPGRSTKPGSRRSPRRRSINAPDAAGRARER